VFDSYEAFKPHAELGYLRVIEVFAQPEEYSVNQHDLSSFYGVGITEYLQ
jgi:hypothetical protein